MKHDDMGRCHRRYRSPPARGRGLKLHIAAELSKVCMSPPARGRGLKLMKGGDENEVGQVAPRAGAWIETEYAVGY